MTCVRCFLVACAFWGAVNVSTIVSAQQLPSAILSVDPPATLPGLPAAFLVTVSNPDDQAVTLEGGMSLRVSSITGTFLAEDLHGDTVINVPDPAFASCNAATCMTIAAHGQRQIYVDYGPALLQNGFFADPRLATPGTYTLQLVLFKNVGEPGFAEIVSSPANLTIRNPSGADAAAWTFLQSLSASHVWTTSEWLTSSDRIADKIRTDFPASGYVPWVAAMGVSKSRTVSLSNLDAALAMNVPPSLRDNLLLAKADFLRGWSSDALYIDRNLDESLARAGDARTAYDALKKVAFSDLMRQFAVEGTAKLYTQSTARATLDMLVAGDPPAPAAVRPYVQCVAKGVGAAFTARFGYSNPNTARKFLQIGDQNEVTPAPRDQGQPRFFAPGDHPSAFSASSPGGELIWHLDGSKATATADSAAPCPPAQ
jgi:hypothetical protein